MSDFDQSLGQDGGFTNMKHFAGIAVVAIFDYRDVNINDVTVFELFIAGYAMTNYMVD